MKIKNTKRFSLILCIVNSLIINAQEFPRFHTRRNLDTMKFERVSSKLNYYLDIGAYETAMELQGGFVSHHQFEHALNNHDVQRVNQLTGHDAVEYILDKAKGEKLVIINEMHHSAQHRVFTKQLLDGLWNEGFTHLGLEALGNDPVLDSMMQYDRYPIRIPEMQITYAEEPQFSELVRKGFDLGFQVFPYSMTSQQRKERATLSDRRARRLYRDLSMARNIIAILNADTDARLLIHCGYAHAVESIQDRHYNLGKEKWLAAFIKEMTGIDPLTIDQTILTDRTPIASHPFYYTREVDRATIFEDQYGIPFRPNTYFNTDLFVWHPSYHYDRGRPGWLIDQLGYESVHVKIKEVPDYPFLILAQYEHEDVRAVPADVIEVQDEQELMEKVLVLRKGFGYRIYVKDASGRVHLDDVVEIDP